MWLCRSPRMSPSSISRGSASSPPAAPAAALEVGERGGQLAAVLAQLGLDVGEAEQLVELLLARARARAADRVVEHAVLRHVQAAPHDHLAQRRVVASRAGEVLQQVAELRRLGDPQVDARARVRARASRRPCRPSRRARSAAAAEALRERRRACRDGDQVDVLDAVGPPARRAGDEYLRARAAQLGEPRRERLAELERLRQQHARGRALARALLERREHVLLELRPEPADRADPLRERRLAQLLRRVDAELRMQQPRALGAEARQARDATKPGGNFARRLLGGRDRARLEQREDLLFERRADPRELARATFARERRDRNRRVAHAARRRAIGEHAMDDRAVELV